MSLSVIQLPGEPIVIVTIRLPLHEFIEDVAVLNAKVDEILATVQGHVYRISDASQLDEISFSDILLWLGEQQAHRPGSVFDPRIKPIAVGSGRMVETGVRKLAQRTGIHMPLFGTLDEAIDYARAQIARCPAK